MAIEPTVAPPSNPPGLAALSYRLGTHATFFQRMLAALATRTVPAGDGVATRPLAALTTRAPDDFAIALLDAWAAVADVLTFYQERIADEGYLRTATERQSVLQLARAIGYELRPGMAAATYLAFTVEEAPGAPGSASVPPGTRVQSIPGQGQTPQTFETGAVITASAAWNGLRPLLRTPQQLNLAATTLYLAGTALNLTVGDPLLLVVPSPNPKADTTRVARIARLTIDTANQLTRVDLAAPARPIPTPPGPTPAPVPPSPPPTPATPGPLPTPAPVGPRPVAAGSIGEPPLSAPIVAPAAPAVSGGVFAFRTSLACFGGNAPSYASLRLPAPPQPVGTAGAVIPDPNDWDTNPRAIWEDSRGQPYTDADTFLERSVPQVRSQTWALFESPAVPALPYWVAATLDLSLADYATSARVTGLRMLAPDGQSSPVKPAELLVRKTTASVQSEQLPLADLLIADPLPAGTTMLPLDSLVTGLQPDQPLALTGVRLDQPGVIGAEVVFLQDVMLDNGLSTLVFQAGLQHGYFRASVSINANVAPASHGATVANEVLGSGDGSTINQQFALKKPPLTYLAASTAIGVQSTLDVRVNGVRWHEAPTLYGLGPASKAYAVRIADDGTTTVRFGDGVQGARLPTGTENVTATYRGGSGPAGNVAAGALALLQTRPLGIRSVVNPVPASGGAAAEDLAGAQTAAPLTVLTLDRVVARVDYEDFVRGFAGIGQAQATLLPTTSGPLLQLTVAATGGGAVDPTSALYLNLLGALQAASDGRQPVQVDSYEPLFFDLAATVLIDPAFQMDAVVAAVGAALAAAFGFGARQFGQGVTASAVTATMQAAAGVRAVDLTQLSLSTAPPTLEAALPARGAVVNRDAAGRPVVLPAQLLLLNPSGVALMRATP